MSSTNRKALEKAKQNKDDEFYTRMCDIEDELQYYPGAFLGKTVICNCDDPRESNFFKYFLQSFNELGLKKLMTTCYKKSGKAFALIYTGNSEDVDIIPLDGDGDFRSDECIKFLKEADIVVTNPPFSLLKEFIQLMERYNKQYILIVSKNTLQYSSVFPLVAQNKVWMGATYRSAGRIMFERQSGELKYTSANWLTNVKNTRPFEKITLSDTYAGNEEKYPKFDMFDAINVDSMNSIPGDYYGVMGVPITVLSKDWMNDFEIVTFKKDAEGNHVIYSVTDDKVADERYPNVDQESLVQIIPCEGILNSGAYTKIAGKSKFSRILIRRRQKDTGCVI